MAGYCERTDLLAFLPSGGLPNVARMATANASTNAIELDQHGLVDDQEVVFSADTAAGYSVPGGLTAGTTYYAIIVSTSRFKVAATAGGAAIDLTTAGDTFSVWVELPWSKWIDTGAATCESIIGTYAAHVLPLVPDTSRWPSTNGYDPVVVRANAAFAAFEGVGATAGIEVKNQLLDQIREITTRLTEWAKRSPIRGIDASRTSPVNLAITASAGATDPRGWATRGNDVLP